MEKALRNVLILVFVEKQLPLYANDWKQLLCIPLCDGVHFQGYIVDINRYKIIHIDSLLSNNSNNRTSQKIAQNLFESETNVQYECLFPTRRQFDSNSCGVWLVAGIASSVLNLPIPLQKQEATEVAYSLFEYVKSKVTPLLVLDTEEFKKYSSAEFLIHDLLNEPQKSKCFREKTVKGLRNNYFYVIDITQNSLQDINADDNGAYKQIRNTSTMFHYKGDKVYTVYRNGEELYYNRKVLYNRYEKAHVSVEEVVTLHRRYCKAKSFPLKRIEMTINPIDGPIIPYVAVLYQIDSPITEDKRTLCHGNSKEKESRPYI